MNLPTRLLLTTAVLLFLMAVCLISLFKAMDGVAVCCVTGIMTTLSTYVWGQTKRPSQQVNERETTDITNHQNE